MKLSKIIGWIIIALGLISVLIVIGGANGVSFLDMVIVFAVALGIFGILLIGIYLVTKD